MSQRGLLTDISTSRSQEKSSIESVMPFSSALSLSDGVGTRLYSFFKILSEKNWFSLKCYIPRVQYIQQLLNHSKKKGKKEKKVATTHKFDGETSVFFSIFLDPYILEVAKGSLVCIVLNVV